MIKTILLAVDLGAYTSHLLQHAASLSKHYSARLIVVHAIEPLGSLGNALLRTYLEPELREELTTSGLNALVEQIRFRVIDSLTDEYMNGDIDLPRLGEVIVEPGLPVDVILKAAETCKADLLVLGSHSPEMSQHLGSVCHKILNVSKRPVYLVPHAQPLWQQDYNEQRQFRF